MAVCVHLIVPSDLNMFAGMLLGGFIGMVLMLFMMLVLMPFFGAFEVMIPLHLNGMLIGMGSGMLSTLPSLAWEQIILGGAVVGFFVSLYIYFANQSLIQS